MSTPRQTVACPTIISVTVGSAWIRNSKTTSITYPVTAVLGADPNSTDPPLVQSWRSGSIKARSVVTNTPSVTSVLKGHAFTERGKLTRFDNTPQGGQKVNVFYVPAGKTAASYAGTATTSSTGAWALPVRSWFTGSWFVSYPGSAFSTSTYKGAWVRVS